LQQGYDIPLVGCFHYNGHSLLKNYPDGVYHNFCKKQESAEGK
jgi:hypothetical protein